MKSILLQLALRILLLALDGPVRRVLENAVREFDRRYPAMESDLKRSAVVKTVQDAAEAHGRPLPTRVVNLAVEAAVAKFKSGRD